MKYYSVYFADTYGSGAYSSGVYSCAGNSDPACRTTGTAGGGLADTGVMLLGFATLACLIIFVAIIIKVWRRPGTPVPQEQESEDEDRRGGPTLPDDPDQRPQV